MTARLTILTLLAANATAQSWVTHASGTTASFRGISAVSAKIVWVSGTGGTYLVTSDGGETWRLGSVPDAQQLDFRDVHGVDDYTAYLLSSGPGEKSRIYKTTDGGAHWTLQFTNPDPKGFLDAFSFWDPTHGIVLGDPVDSKFVILTTDNGGETWERQPGPAALSNEGAFAASGTCLITTGRREAWFASGGPHAARAFHTKDGGQTWTAGPTPVRNDGAAAGIFSLAFSDPLHGIAAGGDYNKPNDGSSNIAVTSNGGKTWTEPEGRHPAGYRSAVAYVPERRMWITVGTSGSDVSFDGGNTWKTFDTGAYNAVSFAGGVGWAVGPNGRLAQFRFADQ